MLSESLRFWNVFLQARAVATLFQSGLQKGTECFWWVFGAQSPDNTDREAYRSRNSNPPNIATAVCVGRRGAPRSAVCRPIATCRCTRTSPPTPVRLSRRTIGDPHAFPSKPLLIGVVSAGFAGFVPLALLILLLIAAVQSLAWAFGKAFPGKATSPSAGSTEPAGSGSERRADPFSPGSLRLAIGVCYRRRRILASPVSCHPCCVTRDAYQAPTMLPCLDDSVHPFPCAYMPPRLRASINPTPLREKPSV